MGKNLFEYFLECSDLYLQSNEAGYDLKKMGLVKTFLDGSGELQKKLPPPSQALN